jgi:hypothetical protein
MARANHTTPIPKVAPEKLKPITGHRTSNSQAGKQPTRRTTMNMQIKASDFQSGTALSSDPTFAAIERHRAANSALSEFLHLKSEFDDSRRDESGKFKKVPECAKWDKKEDQFGDDEKRAADDLAATIPTTIEGILAKMEYVASEHARGNHIYVDTDLVTVIQTVVDSGLLRGRKTKQHRPCTAEKQITAERENFAKAFTGLEGDVCDLTRMARLAQLQVHETIGELRCEDGKCVEVPDTENVDLAIFAVSLLNDKVKELEATWYRLFNDAVSTGRIAG